MTNKETIELKNEQLNKVTGGDGSLGPYSDWYDLISSTFSSALPLEQKEKRLKEMILEIRQDSRLNQMEKDELYNYINGLLGNGR